MVTREGREDALFELCRARVHQPEILRRDHFAEAGMQSRDGERIGRQRRSNARMPALAERIGGADALRDGVGKSIDRARHTAGDSLATDQEIGGEAMYARVAANAGRKRVRLVDGEW